MFEMSRERKVKIKFGINLEPPHGRLPLEVQLIAPHYRVTYDEREEQVVANTREADCDQLGGARLSKDPESPKSNVSRPVTSR